MDYVNAATNTHTITTLPLFLCHKNKIIDIFKYNLKSDPEQQHALHQHILFTTGPLHGNFSYLPIMPIAIQR